LHLFLGVRNSSYELQNPLKLCLGDTQGESLAPRVAGDAATGVRLVAVRDNRGTSEPPVATYGRSEGVSGVQKSRSFASSRHASTVAHGPELGSDGSPAVVVSPEPAADVTRNDHRQRRMFERYRHHGEEAARRGGLDHGMGQAVTSGGGSSPTSVMVQHSHTLVEVVEGMVTLVEVVLGAVTLVVVADQHSSAAVS
jgi:hypothetical protein